MAIFWIIIGGFISTVNIEIKSPDQQFYYKSGWPQFIIGMIIMTCGIFMIKTS